MIHAIIWAVGIIGALVVAAVGYVVVIAHVQAEDEEYR